MLGIGLDNWHALCHHKWNIHTLPAIIPGASMFIISFNYHNGYYLAHFTGEETEAQ